MDNYLSRSIWNIIQKERAAGLHLLPFAILQIIYKTSFISLFAGQK